MFKAIEDYQENEEIKVLEVLMVYLVMPDCKVLLNHIKLLKTEIYVMI